MPTTFVQIGSHFVNLDVVSSVEFVSDPHDPARTIAARIHYTTGKEQDFTAASEVQALAAWLRTHKAP